MNSITRKLVSCALCIALGVLLPMAFHVIPNAGSIFLPMHIPVLICGLFCGWPYGLACGILTPFISSVTTGMPPAMILPQMMVELAVYGLVTGLCASYIPVKNEMTKLYMSLIIAMLAGRIMNGLVNTCILSTQGYTLSVFMSANFQIINLIFGPFLLSIKIFLTRIWIKISSNIPIRGYNHKFVGILFIVHIIPIFLFGFM